MNFSFKRWLEELSFHDEFSPPPGHEGPGLICFDFDKTLTTAQPMGGWYASTSEPNMDMIEKLRRHKQNGNHCIIVTGRGTDVDKYEKWLGHPSISVEDALRDWGIGKYVDEVIMTGGVAHNDLEDKAPKILSTMERYHASWCLLYDDNKKNVQQVNDLGAKTGRALRAIQVPYKITKTAGALTPAAL